MTVHETKYKAAVAAIDAVCSDTSVAIETTLDSMEKLKELTETNINAMQEDIEARDE